MVPPKEKLINSSIFGSFNKLTNDDESARIKGAYALIKSLVESSDKEPEKFARELKYALNRLIRGNGSSSSNSRIGFHTALTGLLNSDIENLPSVTLVMEILTKEFHSIDEKAKVDNQVGTALVCGAVIRSKLVALASEEELEQLTKCLVVCLAKPAVYSLSYSFLNELIVKVSTEIFSSIIWSQMKKPLSISKDDATLDSVYFLLLAEEHHKEAIEATYYKKYWPKSTAILGTENFNVLLDILWKNKKQNSINHPFYEYFAKRLTESKLLKTFWSQYVDKLLVNTTKQLEITTVHVAISIMKNLNDKPNDLLKILTPNFLFMLNASTSKTFKVEDVQDMFTEFYDLLDQRLLALNKDDIKLQALSALIKDPGSILLEKNANKKFLSNLINSLELDGLMTAVTAIKSIIAEDKSKDSREKLYAVSVLQKILTSNKLVSSNIQWRIEQLSFLVNLGIFKSINGKDLVEEEVNQQVSTNVRNVFYHCLEYKLPKLEDEKKVLLGVVQHINGVISKGDPNCYLQVALKKNHIATWQKMMQETTKKDQKKVVFHVLLLHMGLQLFNNSDVAESAINELECVIARVNQKKTQKDEPEWIEVVIDLFLNLLSQNSNVLRNVIRHVFPQLCSQMTVTAFHQILALLDLQVKENPLMVNAEENDEESESESEEDEGVDSGNEEGTEEDNEAESEEEEDIEDDTETINDTVRLAIQNALGDAAGGDDMDVDDMDEEEGVRLDEALANAFKLLKASKKQKKSKADKIADKTLLHFRMRLMDLVEIYLKNSPKMDICLEIVMFLYELMPIATKEEKQKVLLTRFDGVFLKISQLKGFTTETIKDVTQKSLADTLRNMLETTIKGKTFPQQLNHLTRVCLFLINCSQVLQKLVPTAKASEDTVLGVLKENMKEFMEHRNPTLQLSTYQKILATQWTGNYQLAIFISDQGLKSTTRSLRRMQSFQLLKEFYKNHHLLAQENTKDIQKIEVNIRCYAEEVKEASEPEFLEFLLFLQTIRTFYLKKKDFSMKDCLVAAVERFRKQLVLKFNVLNVYKAFCQTMAITAIENGKAKKPKVNGTAKNGIAKEVTEDDETPKENGAQKRKKGTDHKKEKKLKKQMRLQAGSEGFNTSFTFVGAI
ncbi:unnamed protein product [Diamesa serratosioi]